MTETVDTQAIARGVLESLSDQTIVISVPGTSYRIHLTLAVPANSISTPVGKRIKGTVHANGLRIFGFTGGGTFIEPIQGQPRIVAGRVLAVDAAQRRLLVNVTIPMWITILQDQSPAQFAEGQMVNCYVESGASFTPVV